MKRWVALCCVIFLVLSCGCAAPKLTAEYAVSEDKEFGGIY